VQLGLTAAQAHDNQCETSLVARGCLADRGYDADWIRAFVAGRGCVGEYPAQVAKTRSASVPTYLYREMPNSRSMTQRATDAGAVVLEPDYALACR